MVAPRRHGATAARAYEMHILARIVNSPWSYGVWAVLVLSALGYGYLADPYIFAFAALILAWPSAAFGLIGLTVVLFSRAVAAPAKAAIVLSVGVTAGALAVAFAVLRTFKWA